MLSSTIFSDSRFFFFILYYTYFLPELILPLKWYANKKKIFQKLKNNLQCPELFFSFFYDWYKSVASEKLFPYTISFGSLFQFNAFLVKMKSNFFFFIRSFVDVQLLSCLSLMVFYFRIHKHTYTN